MRLFLKSLKAFFSFVIRLNVLIYPSFLLAKADPKIWIKAPQMSFQEFKTSVEALGSPHISYAEHLLLQERERARAFQLKEKLLLAQEFYLSGEGKKAIRAFKRITDLALSANWTEEDRRNHFVFFFETSAR